MESGLGGADLPPVDTDADVRLRTQLSHLKGELVDAPVGALDSGESTTKISRYAGVRVPATATNAMRPVPPPANRIKESLTDIARGLTTQGSEQGSHLSNRGCRM